MLSSIYLQVNVNPKCMCAFILMYIQCHIMWETNFAHFQLYGNAISQHNTYLKNM